MQEPGDTTKATQPTFQGPVSFGKGIYLSARRGVLTIEAGDVRLTRRDGSLVAQAPAAEVWFAKGVDSLKAWICDQRFILRPGTGAKVHMSGNPSAAYGANLATKQYKQFKAFATIVLAAAEADGAHIGKPGAAQATDRLRAD